MLVMVVTSSMSPTLHLLTLSPGLAWVPGARLPWGISRGGERGGRIWGMRGNHLNVEMVWTFFTTVKSPLASTVLNLGASELTYDR